MWLGNGRLTYPGYQLTFESLTKLIQLQNANNAKSYVPCLGPG